MSNKNRNRRKLRKKNKTFTPAFGIFLIIISLAILIMNFFKHDYFKISQVYIKGNKFLSDEQILKGLNNPVGKNIIMYDEEESIDKLKKDEIIKSVKIEKKMPDEIIVKVKEEYPYMYTNYKKEKYIVTNN